MAISVEDERIVKSIEENAERQVIAKITADVEDIIYRKHYGYYREKDNKEPLRELIKERIDAILEENKPLILDEASTKLAERLSKTKAAKAILEGLV